MYYLLAVIIAFSHYTTLICADCVINDANDARCSSLTSLSRLLPFAPVIHDLEVNCKSVNESVHEAHFIVLQHLNKLSLHGCGDIALKILHVVSQLHHLNLTGNNVTVAPWQKFQHVVTNVLDLRGNPLSCDHCENSWIWAYQRRDKHALGWDPHFAVKLPLVILTDSHFDACDFRKCPAETVVADSKNVARNLSLGEPLNLHCRIDTLNTYNNDSARPSFIWPYSTPIERRESKSDETWNAESHEINFNLSAITSNELGYAVCVCQWCSRPVFDKFELKFPTNLSVHLEEDGRDATMIVHGYPLNALTLSVTRLVDNVTEDVDLSNAKVYLFNESLIIKPQAAFSHDFLTYYSLIVQECVLCSKRSSHIDSDYVITVCRANGNATICAVAVGQLVNAHHTHKKLNPIDFQNNDDSHIYVSVVLFLGIAIIVLIILFSRTHIKHKLLKKGWEIRRRRISRNTDRTEETSIRLEDYSASNSMNYIVQHVPIIERDALEMKERIGKGAFGEVYVGEWWPKDDVTSPTKVAIKMLFNVQLDSELDKEAALLAMLDHPNIVKLFGIARSEGQVSLVMEMMNLGDLKTFVRDRAPRCDNYSQFPPALIPSELLNMAGQVAAGLCYLTSQNIVHRDLAGRNCLVQGESDIKFCNAAFRKSITVKISDFGMSRRLFSDTEYYKMHNSKTALPVRWLPPECLSLGKFTPQSDMWSFGMVLYEIFSFGAMPYGDLSNSEVVSAVMNGARPKLPATFPEPINALIEACWRTDPELRITATEALNRLGIIT